MCYNVKQKKKYEVSTSLSTTLDLEVKLSSNGQCHSLIDKYYINKYIECYSVHSLQLLSYVCCG